MRRLIFLLPPRRFAAEGAAGEYGRAGEGEGEGEGGGRRPRHPRAWAAAAAAVARQAMAGFFCLSVTDV